MIKNIINNLSENGEKVDERSFDLSKYNDSVVKLEDAKREILGVMQKVNKKIAKEFSYSWDDMSNVLDDFYKDQGIS